MYINIVDCEGNITLRPGEKYTLSSSTYTTLEFSVGEAIISIPRNSALTPPSFLYKWDDNELKIQDPLNGVIKCDVHTLAGELRVINIDARNITRVEGVAVASHSRVGAATRLNFTSTIPSTVYEVEVSGQTYGIATPAQGVNQGNAHYCDVALYPQVVVLNG